jgi:hypothetical protein
MRASPKPRKTANLSKSIHQQLSMYALAASAAGVGALCFAKPAEARIVYTPAHVAIKPNGGLFRIDLNHDGIPDFGLSNNRFQSTEMSDRNLLVRQSLPANEIWIPRACVREQNHRVPLRCPRVRGLDLKESSNAPHTVLGMAYAAATIFSHPDRLRLRDDPRQSDRRWRDQGARRQRTSRIP